MEGRIKLGKRLCAWLLSFALLLGLVPGVVMEASAADTILYSEDFSSTQGGWSYYEYSWLDGDGSGNSASLEYNSSALKITTTKVAVSSANPAILKNFSSISIDMSTAARLSVDVYYPQDQASYLSEVEVTFHCGYYNNGWPVETSGKVSFASTDSDEPVSNLSGYKKHTLTLSALSNRKENGSKIQSLTDEQKRLSCLRDVKEIIIAVNTNYNESFENFSFYLDNIEIIGQTIDNSTETVIKTWDFTSGNPGWEQSKNTPIATANGTLPVSVNVTNGPTWNTSSVYIENGNGIATKGGAVTFHVVYKTEAASAVESLKTKVAYSYDNWIYLGSTSTPQIGTGTSISGTEYSFARVTFTADQFELSVASIVPKKLSIEFCGDSSTQSFNGTIWLDNITIGDTSGLPNTPNVPVVSTPDPVDTVPASTAAGINGTLIWNSAAESETVGGWSSGYQGTVAASGTVGVVKATMTGDNYYKVVADYGSPNVPFGPVAVNLIHKKTDEESDLKELAGNYTIEWAYKPDGSTWTTVSQAKSPNGIDSTNIIGDWYCTTVLFDFTADNLKTLKNLNQSQIQPERLQLVIEGNNNISDLYFDKVTVGAINESVTAGYTINFSASSDVEGRSPAVTSVFKIGGEAISGASYNVTPLAETEVEVVPTISADNGTYTLSKVQMSGKEIELPNNNKFTVPTASPGTVSVEAIYTYDGTPPTTYSITLKAYDGENYAANFTKDAFDPDGTEGTDCRSYTYTDGQSTTVTVNYVVWGSRYLQKLVVDGVKRTVTGQNQTFTFDDSADHTITAYYKYSETELSAGDIARDPPWRFDSGTEGWSHGSGWNYGATGTAFAYDSTNQRLTLTGVDYKKQNVEGHLKDAGKLSVGFDAADPFTLKKGTNRLKLKLGYSFSDAAKDLTVKVSLKSPGDTDVVNEAARLVSVSASGSSEVNVLFPALTADTQIKSVTLDIYSATYQGNLWIDDVSFAHVDTCKVTLSTDNGKWLNIFQVNGQPISVNNDDKKTEVLVEKGSDVTVTVARRPDENNYWLTALHVDGFKQTVTEQDQTVTLLASVDHTVTAYYEYSSTPITPIAPAVSATPVTTTTNEGTATVDAADTVTTALTSGKAAGIMAKDANNVALDAAVVAALATNESNKGSNGVVAVIETQNATVEAPAAMFENAKNGSAAIAVTLETKSKNAGSAASDETIKNAVGTGNTDKVKGALDISLVKTGGTNEEVKVDLGANAAKPITIRTTVAPNLTKRLLHIGYLEGTELVYDNTVQLLDYDSTNGELSFTTTHYTTFVFVSDSSLNFYNGRLTVKNETVGFNATDWALEKGTLSIDNSGKLSMTGLALPTKPKYSDGSEYASTSYSSGDYYVLKWAGGEISNLGGVNKDGVNMVDLTIDYDLSQIEKDSGDDKWGSVTDLLVSVFVRGEKAGDCKALSLDPGTDGGTVEVTFDLDTMRYEVDEYNVNTPELEFRVYAIGYGGSYPASSSVQISDISLYSVTKYRATFSATVGFDHVEDSAFKMGGLSVFGWEKYYSTYAHTRNVGSPVVVSANVWTGYRLIGLKVNDITPSDFKIGKEYTVYVYQNGTTIEAEYASVYSGATVSPTADIAVGGNPVAPSGETVIEAAATVKDGIAALTVEAGDVKKLLAQAKASEEPVTTITLAPAIADDVSITKTELSISAADLGTIGEGSEASLKIDSPIAAITITNEAVEALAAAGESVTFISETKDSVVDIAVTSGGERLTSIAGGIRAEIAVKAAPGLMAILLPAKEENTSSEAITRAKLVLAAPTAGIAAAGGEEGTPLRWAAANQRGDAMLIKLDGSARIRFVDKTKTFSDVPSESWGASAVSFVSGHGIFDGYDDGKFYPNVYMNRAMLVKILHNFEGNPNPALKASFRDVPANAWYAEAVAWASGSGVVKGIGDNWFDVNSRITRQDAVTILYRYMGEPEVTDISILDRYDDRKSIAAYAEKAMAWALKNKIISGVTAKTLAPREAMTRHQVARLMMDLVMSQVQ